MVARPSVLTALQLEFVEGQVLDGVVAPGSPETDSILEWVWAAEGFFVSFRSGRTETVAVSVAAVAEGSFECPHRAGGADGRSGMGVEGRVTPEGKVRRRETGGDIGPRCRGGGEGLAVFVSLASELCCEEEEREGCDRDDTVIVWACAMSMVFD